MKRLTGQLDRYKAFFSTTRRISFGLGALKFIKAVFTIFSVILSAKYFGTSLQRDAWILAGTVITILTQIAFGPINEIFRAKFIHIREEDSESKALTSTSSLMGTILCLSLLAILACELAPDMISTFFAPGFNDEQRKVLALMVRFVFPTFLLNELTIMWIAILNTHRSFFIPDVYSLVSVAITVVCIVLFAPLIGIYSLIVSTYIGTILLVMVLIYALKKIDARLLNISMPSWAAIKPFVLYSLPFYLAYLIGNVQLAVERMLCTYLGVGSVSVLDYARKFTEMPMTVIVGVLTTVLTPTLAGLHATKKDDDFHQETIKFIRLLILGLIPLVVIFTVCSKELVELLLMRGSFKKEYVNITANSLFFFSFGFIGYALYAIGATAIIARNKAAHYALIGSIGAAVGLALNLLLFKSVGLIVFPISWGLMMFASGLYMCLYDNNYKKQTSLQIAEMLGLMLFIVGISFLIKKLINPHIYVDVLNTNIHNLLTVGSIGVLSNLVYVLLLFKFDFEEIRGIKNYFFIK